MNNQGNEGLLRLFGTTDSDAIVKQMMDLFVEKLVEPLNNQGDEGPQIITQEAPTNSPRVYMIDSPEHVPHSSTTQGVQTEPIQQQPEPSTTSSGTSNYYTPSGGSTDNHAGLGDYADYRHDSYSGSVPTYNELRFEDLSDFMDFWKLTGHPGPDGNYSFEGILGRFTPEALHRWMNGVQLFAIQTIVYAHGVAMINSESTITAQTMREVINRYLRGMEMQFPLHPRGTRY